MQVRISLWHSMTKMGWALPRRAPLTKAERIVDQRLRQAIADAQASSDEEDDDVVRPCRSIRLLVGMRALS